MFTQHTFAVLAASGLLWISGCEKQPQQDVRPVKANAVQVGGNTIPVGTAVEYTNTTTESTDEGETTSFISGEATGAGLQTSAAEQVGSFNSEAPNLELSQDGTSRSSGGGSLFDFSLKGWKLNELALVGAVLALGAGFAAVRKRFPLALALGAGAGLCFVGSALPLWVIGICILGAGFLYWRWNGSHEALRGVLEGVEDLPNEVRRAAKRAISKRTDVADKNTIRAVKVADDLPSERTE